MGYKGRHRKPTNTGRNVTRAATAGVVAFTPLSVTPIAHADTAPPVDQLAELLACESGGSPEKGVINWTRENESGSSASGAYQIIDGTWRAYGGLEFAPRARDASPQEQTLIAARIAARGGVSQWACADDAGFTDPRAISWDNVLRLTGETKVEVKTEVAPVPSPEPAETAAPEPAATPKPVTSGRHHRVDPGDTLSGIAYEYRLGAWQPLYEANRDVVGSNPHLIYPGQDLRLPGDAEPAAAVAPVAPSPAPAAAVASASERVTEVAPAPEPVAEVVVGAVVSDIGALLSEQPATGFSGVVPKVARAGHLIAAEFSVSRILGVGPRPRVSDHGDGYALDFMVSGVVGDKIADYVLAHMDELDVKYVIWQQRINHGNGWKRMEDRGSATANHRDHVHVSFNR